MMYSRILAAVIVVAATLWIGSGVLGRTESPAEGSSEASAPAAQPLFQVAVVTAKVQEHSRVLALSGRTEADNRARAVARTLGSIVELKVERGDVVKEGDILATLSDEAREAQVAEAEAMVQMRKTDLEAKVKLIERGVMAANDKNQIEADLRAAESTLAQARAEHERGLIRAPISGVVSDVPVTAGQSLEMNAVVAEVIALDPMLAVAEVAERQLGDIKVGDPTEVRLVTGQTAKGKVRYVSPTASGGTRTYRVEVELDNADLSIADGVTAEVEFRLAPVAAAKLPRSALTFSTSGELSVRIVGADGIVASVPVAIVEDARDEVWVAGPKDGVQIIVQGQDFVKDGQTVGTVDAAGDLRPALISKS
jgi:multidrug efflux system membrane fusion protein